MSAAEKDLPSYVEPTYSQWENETIKSWIYHALGVFRRCEDKERVRIGWIGNMKTSGKGNVVARSNRIAKHMAAGNIVSRSLIIPHTDIKLWNRFANTCHLPYYMEDRYWGHPNAENYRLVNFAAVALIHKYDDKYIKYGRDRRRMPDLTTRPITIMTVFHTALGKRLIADGVHRATAIVNHLHRKGKLPVTIKVRELAGPMLHLYFPYDFASMIVGELLNIKPPMEL